MTKRSECDCPCHRPGNYMLHVQPCCSPDDKSPFEILDDLPTMAGTYTLGEDDARAAIEALRNGGFAIVPIQLLKDAQWVAHSAASADASEEAYCFACGGFEPNHKEGCRLKAAIGE